MNLKTLIPTKIYLELQFFHHFKRFFSFREPKTMNEKVQWLKVYYRNHELIDLVDKVKVKKIIADLIGNEYIIETYGVWNDAEQIDWEHLPEKYVLKCNHDSHCVYISDGINKVNRVEATNTLKERLKYNFYWYAREWPYKYVKPQILAEKLLENLDGHELVDYKILCFNGKVDNIMICSGRQEGKLKFYYFDREWNFLRYQPDDKYLPDDFTVKKPENLEKMFEIAEVLSEGKPLTRVDLYECNGQVYFGELTFYPSAGFDTDITPETDLLLGQRIHLPN
ncbi:MAG: ATP-grasp fold amidoligase family protein [Eubacteriales bacterium]|nr:ATP-grasp fold amidoligase family protein [Eubacteriales bacterium]